MHFSPIEFATGALRLCVWLALLTALFVPLERWFGQRHEGSNPELRHNLAYYFISSLVPIVFLTLPMALLAALAQQLVPSSLVETIAGLPLAARLALAFWLPKPASTGAIA